MVVSPRGIMQNAVDLLLQYVPPVPTSSLKLNSDVDVDEPQVVGMVMIGVGDGFDVPDTRGAHSQIGVREAMGRMKTGY